METPAGHSSGVDQSSWIYNRAAPQERELLRRDQDFSIVGTANDPCLIAVRRAEGIWVEDISGRRYRDLYGNNCHHIGYGHPRLVQALKDQLDTLAFVPRGFANPVAVDFASRLAELAGHPNAKIVSGRSGADAVEIALSIARASTSRSKTISFYDSYHGRSAGALSIGGRYDDRKGLEPLLPGSIRIPPYYRHGKAPVGLSHEGFARKSLDTMATVFEYERDIAAVVAETIRNGPYTPPDWYWPEVRRLCDAYDALLILDEIATGLGKTGSLFNFTRFDVQADIVCVGKALGGGAMPLSAAIVGGGLDVPKHLNVGYYTHDKNPLCAQAGLTTLEIIEDEKLVENARFLGLHASERLLELQARFPVIAEVRTAGLMLSLEFGSDGIDGAQRSAQVFRDCVDRSVIPTFPRQASLTFSAPLVISLDELDNVLDTIAEAIGCAA